MPTFPLTDCPLYGSYNVKGGTNAVVRTQMEVGPPKVRRRSSLALYAIEAGYGVTREDIANFEMWYRDTIGMGAITFDWSDPRTGTTRAVRFTDGGYAVEQISPGRWALHLSLEAWE
jgi:hypothetical protein